MTYYIVLGPTHKKIIYDHTAQTLCTWYLHWVGQILSLAKYGSGAFSFQAIAKSWILREQKIYYLYATFYFIHQFLICKERKTYCRTKILGRLSSRTRRICQSYKIKKFITKEAIFVESFRKNIYNQVVTLSDNLGGAYLLSDVLKLGVSCNPYIYYHFSDK